MENTNSRLKTFAFLGNFPVYNSTGGLVTDNVNPEFTINIRSVIEFDTVQLRFMEDQNLVVHNISAGRPYAVELDLASVSMAIAAIENIHLISNGFVPLSGTTYNSRNAQYVTISFLRANKDVPEIGFTASNGASNKEFTIKGELQIKMFLEYLKTALDIAKQALVIKESNKLNNRAGTATRSPAPAAAPAAAPSASPAAPAPAAAPAAPSASPAPAAPSASPAPAAPSASPAPAAAPSASQPAPAAAPTIDLPDMEIPF